MPRFLKSWEFWVVAAVVVFFVPFGLNLERGTPPTTIWQDIKSGKLHLPDL